MSTLLASHLWGPLLVALEAVLALTTSLHALVTKSDPRGAFGWIAVCLLFPLAGAVLYYIFGINRVQTRAKRLRDGKATTIPAMPAGSVVTERSQLTHIGDAITQRPRLGGNAIEPLHNGEAAYPPMLEAIAAAQRRIWLATYIFDTDRVGHRFIDALAAAQARGVEVRVLVDGIGELYGFPRAAALLRRRGVHAARFLPPRLMPPMLYLNLRNHRKLLLVDDTVGFTGGMNISARHVDEGRGRRVTDMHFRVRGPVLTQLAEAFVVDWHFVTGETLPMPQAATEAGDSVCRVITDGPDEDLDKLLLAIAGAISAARREVLIMTPYFIPSLDLMAVLQSAALRGVAVTVVLPQRSDLRYVDWASRRWLGPLLERGVQVVLQPPPFAHTKLFVVDGIYAQIGSANIDPRSLRLNFEIAVEIFDEQVCAILAQHIETVRARSQPVRLESLRSDSFPVRVRNGLSWLLSPYL